jgi:tetratricopeptide (TPR) repeat protein
VLASGQVSSETRRGIEEVEADLRQGRFDAALTKARALTQAEPRNALAFTFLGMASLHLNQLDQARSAFERSIQLDAADPRPHLNLALLYASGNQLDKAIHSYQQGLALDHRNPTAHYNLGRLLLTSGRFVEAAKALEESLQLRGGDAEARIALVEALLGAGQRDHARSQAELCLQSSLPAEMVMRLGAALVRGNETALAETALERARTAAPNSPAVYIELSRLRSTLKQHEGAVLAARHAVKLAPQALEGYLALAEALIGGKRHLEAVDTLSEVQSQFQSSASFHYTLGVAQSGAHLPQPAIESLERAVNLDPRYDVAQFLLGIAYYRVGNLEKAERAFLAATALNSRNATYFTYLARLYEQKGPQYETQARQATLRAVALDPNEAESNLRLAKWAIAEEDLARARSILEVVVAGHPQVITARVLLAKVYSRLKLTDEAGQQQRVIETLEAEQRKRTAKANGDETSEGKSK